MGEFIDEAGFYTLHHPFPVGLAVQWSIQVTTPYEHPGDGFDLFQGMAPDCQLAGLKIANLQGNGNGYFDHGDPELVTSAINPEQGDDESLVFVPEPGVQHYLTVKRISGQGGGQFGSHSIPARRRSSGTAVILGVVLLLLVPTL